MNSPSTKVKLAAAPSTSKARSNFLRTSNRIVELSHDAFKDAFFTHGLTVEKCQKYAPSSVLRTAKAKIPQHVEKRAYKPICNLLDEISQLYCEGEGVNPKDRVAFVDHSSHPPCRHPHPHIDKIAVQMPDILALKATLALIWGKDLEAWDGATHSQRGKKPAIAWHHIISAIEAKGTADNRPLPQAATYAGSVMQSRPDLGGCFGLAVAARFFQVVWSDSSAVYASAQIPWGSKQVGVFLAQYVHFLHRPPVVDSTVILKMPRLANTIGSALNWEKRPYATPPEWTVEDDRGNVYLVDYLLTVGEPWTRKNWVVRSTRYGPKNERLPKKPCPAVIIKDSFLEQERLDAATEGVILDRIHGTTQDPHVTKGVMTKIHDLVVLDGHGQRIQNVHVPNVLRNKQPIPRRTKYRLLLHGSATMSLYRCESVQQLLMVLYDVLSVLRHVHKEDDILHKDVSPVNVMMYPKDFIEEAGVTYAPAGQQPVFIRQLLAYKDDNPEAQNHPTCIVIDFDNATIGNAHIGEWRTGTPAFIARNVASGETSDRSFPAWPIPALDGDAKASYVRIFGQEHYDANCVLHNDLRPPHGQLKIYPEVVHGPRHDAESCYWLAVHSLMLALPLGADPEQDDTTAMSDSFRLLDSHQIGRTDYRGKILDLREDGWEKILHPGLRELAPFVRNLQNCVIPDWDVFDPPPPAYNVHEAMQRLILQEVWRLQATGPIPLEVDKRRVPKHVSMEGYSSTRPTLSMKTAADQSRSGAAAQEQTGNIGKRKRQTKKKKEASETDEDAEEPKVKRARKQTPRGPRKASSSAVASRKSERIQVQGRKKKR